MNLHSIAWSQNKDSLKCFNIKEQRIIVKKLIQLKECERIQIEMNEQIVFQDSIIRIQEEIIDEEREKFELADIIYNQEREKRIQAEKTADKFKRRSKILGGTSIAGFVCAGVFYLLHSR